MRMIVSEMLKNWSYIKNADSKYCVCLCELDFIHLLKFTKTPADSITLMKTWSCSVWDLYINIHLLLHLYNRCVNAWVFGVWWSRNAVSPVRWTLETLSLCRCSFIRTQKTRHLATHKRHTSSLYLSQLSHRKVAQCTVTSDPWQKKLHVLAPYRQMKHLRDTLKLNLLWHACVSVPFSVLALISRVCLGRRASQMSV